jgi:L-threonylcarbamoyladenylate synthase
VSSLRKPPADERSRPIVIAARDRSLGAEDCAVVAQAVRAGGLVAFPTDTVYGVGANAAMPAAIDRLFRAKGRPPQMALPVLLGDAADLEVCARLVTGEARALVERFWPGPLTIVFPRTDAVCAEAVAGGETVALRLPDHEIARQIVREAGVAVAVTSANPSGAPATTEAGAVIATLGSWLDVVVEEAAPGSGVASTVIDVTVSPPRVLRWGGVTRARIEQVIGCITDAAP